MQANSLTRMKLKSILLLAFMLVSWNGFCQLFSTDNEPCVNDVVTYGVYDCNLDYFQIPGATSYVDYELVTPSNGKQFKIKWLKPRAYTLQISYSGCISRPSGASELTANVGRNQIGLPFATYQGTICELQEAKLTFGDYGNIVRWFNADNTLIGDHIDLDLGLKPTGSYSYKARIINPNSCPVTGTNIVESTFNLAVTDECDDNLNWIESRTYNFDQSIVAQSRTYYDDFGKPLQSQQMQMTNTSILASQTIEDELGRIAVSTLPAPTSDSSFKYRKRFVTNSAGQEYSFKDFDSPVGHVNEGSLGWYYSDNNPDSIIPHTAYPYSRTTFYVDGMAEAKASAGAGDVMTIASGHVTISRTYGTVSELYNYLQLRKKALPGSEPVATLQGQTIQSIARDVNGKYSVSISDRSGKTLITAMPGSADDYVLKNVYAFSQAQNNEIEFYLLENTSVAVSPGDTSLSIENFVTNQKVSTFSSIQKDSNGKWLAGFYRISGGVNWTISFEQYFKNVSYSFYDDAGRLRVLVTPNGAAKLKVNAGEFYTDPESMDSTPLVDLTTYKYNYQGWLLQTREVDAGTVNFVYRKDGKIRFSQNALQKINNQFSYTHYDRDARPIESGVYKGSVPFVKMDDPSFENSIVKSLLEKSYEEISWPIEDKADWVRTNYDRPSTDIPTDLSGILIQENLRLSTASTQNQFSQSWYSYDELGRVTWMAQKPKVLNRIFVIKYRYDFLGKITTVANLSYNTNGELLSQFHHHYTYDADQRLLTASTSLTETGEKTLRATYFYYLHGPLKRIELGNKVQGIDFVYNIQGWLTQINHPQQSKDPGHDTDDAFGMVIDYYESDIAPVVSSNNHPGFSPNKFHGLPESQLAATQKQQPLIRFEAPEINGDLPFKKYSAESQTTREMMSAIEK